MTNARTPREASVSPASFFVLRTPLLPFSVLSEWTTGLRAPSAAPAELPAALAADRLLLRERLVALFERPEVREAVFIASPSLDESLGTWREKPEGEHGQKVERTLVRYLARMAGRPTPFGLFAGCSLGRVGSATDLRTNLCIEGLARYGRHTRLDGDYLFALTEAISRDAGWRATASFRPNETIYRASGRLRYVAARRAGSERSYHLVAAEASEYLVETLARARGGASLGALAEALVGDDITRDDADAFIDELVDSQLLVSDLQPQVTGREPIHDLIDQLASCSPTAAVAGELARTRDALARLDALALGVSPTAYREVAGELDGMPVPAELSRLFQIDMVKASPDATLGPEVVREIVRGVEILRTLASRPRETPLTRFREAFTRRYEGREVPLLEALDEGSGVGFEVSSAPSAEASPLLEGLAFGRGDADDDEMVAWNARTRLLLGKLEDAVRRGVREVTLEPADLEPLSSRSKPPLAASIAAMATLAAGSPEAFASGEFLVWLHGVSGPSGANLLGRFCHGDEALTACVIEHLRAEEAQRPGVIFAEVVHLPEGRIGNVLLRPLLRSFEIPYLGRSGAAPEQQIAVDDLWVSIEAGRVVLRSRRHACEVVPRLTTAHNFASPRNLSLYRFLCALQRQEMSGIGFSWGPLESASFLPRVRIGKLVLSLARWRLDGATVRALTEVDEPRRYALLQALRHQRGLPRWVAVADGDNVLPIDLDNPLSIATFAQLVRHRTSVVLTEVFELEQLCARGPEGAFVHEIVLPLVVSRPADATDATDATKLAVRPRPQLVRVHPPGSSWLYAKLYTEPATVDVVLREIVAPVVRAARASGAVSSWFFIRFGDPDWHLRVRLRGDPRRLLAEVLPSLAAEVEAGVAAGKIRKLQLDTYEPEVERYGGDHGMPLAEELFAVDSEACLAIVETLSGDAGADARWRLALRGMDMLLEDFGCSLAQKQAIAQSCRSSFAAEFHAEGALQRQVLDKLRRDRRELEILLDPSHDATSPLEPGLVALRQRSVLVRPIAALLRERERAGRLDRPLPVLLSSFLHMHANRMLRAAARAQELVLYTFLERLYEGRIARSKQSGRNRD